MFHGNSKIIRRSSLDEDLNQIFIAYVMSGNGSYFEYNSPSNEIENAIVEFLNRENFFCNKKYIEYWFQTQTINEELWPHVDFNHGLRLQLESGKKISKEKLMSPITLACYLEVDDMIGGEFCISHKSWLEYDKEPPLEVLRDDLKKVTHEMYKPARGDVLYFEGSKYYHWINKVLQGNRKSMLINFWDEIDLPLSSVL